MSQPVNDCNPALCEAIARCIAESSQGRITFTSADIKLICG
ncbi:hypothetical protein [Chroococcidiopsis sp. CCMEE 29]|nr:hypothetical protein [Chroococcidiopsis sp. CCMEE 29]